MDLFVPPYTVKTLANHTRKTCQDLADPAVLRKISDKTGSQKNQKEFDTENRGNV